MVRAFRESAKVGRRRLGSPSYILQVERAFVNPGVPLHFIFTQTNPPHHPSTFATHVHFSPHNLFPCWTCFVSPQFSLRSTRPGTHHRPRLCCTSYPIHSSVRPLLTLPALAVELQDGRRRIVDVARGCCCSFGRCRKDY